MVYFLIIAAAVAIDQLSKNAVLNAIGVGGKPIAVIDGFFYITCHRNSGAAWGIFQGGRYFFIVLTLIALVFVGYAMHKVKDAKFRMLMSLFVGGAIGNFVDRLIHGGVVDFLDFYIFGYNFPTFNAADSYIVVGAFALAFYLMVNKDILAQFEKKPCTGTLEVTQADSGDGSGSGRAKSDEVSCGVAESGGVGSGIAESGEVDCSVAESGEVSCDVAKSGEVGHGTPGSGSRQGNPGAERDRDG